MLSKLQENLLFPYQLAGFITAAWGGSGSHWSPCLLLPLLCICQVSEKPEVGSTGSQAASSFPAEERLKWTFGVTRLQWRSAGPLQHRAHSSGIATSELFPSTAIHWKSASCKDGGPGFLALLGLWGSQLLFGLLKRSHNVVFQLLISWFPLPWRRTFVFLNGKGQCLWFCSKLVWKPMEKITMQNRDAFFCRTFNSEHSRSWFDWNYPEYIQQMLFLSSQNSPPTLLAFKDWFNTQTIIMWLIIYCTVSACGADWSHLVCLEMLIAPGSR